MMQAILWRTAPTLHQPLRGCIRALLLALLLMCSVAHALGDLSCTIVGASEVAADGSLNPLAGKKNYYENVSGAEFIVQRESGTMMGRFVNNSGIKVSVIDRGSANTS